MVTIIDFSWHLDLFIFGLNLIRLTLEFYGDLYELRVETIQRLKLIRSFTTKIVHQRQSFCVVEDLWEEKIIMELQNVDVVTFVLVK